MWIHSRVSDKWSSLIYQFRINEVFWYTSFGWMRFSDIPVSDEWGFLIYQFRMNEVFWYTSFGWMRFSDKPVSGIWGVAVYEKVYCTVYTAYIIWCICRKNCFYCSYWNCRWIFHVLYLPLICHTCVVRQSGLFCCPLNFLAVIENSNFHSLFIDSISLSNYHYTVRWWNSV